MRYIFFIAVTFFTSGVFAQQDSSLLKEVIITAHRNPTSISKTTSSASALKETQIMKMQSRSVPEMLMNMPGVFMQKTGHAGGSPFVRGLTGYQILQLTDGIRINNSTFRYGPNQYLSTLDPFTIQRAEVIRGSGATLHGSDAMGGVVSLFSNDPEFSKKGVFHGKLNMNGISRNMEKTGSASISYSNSNIAAEIIGSSSNYGDIVGANQLIFTPSSYKQKSFHAKLKYKLSENVILTGVLQQVEQFDVDLPDQVRQRGFMISKIDPQKRQLSYLRLDASLKSFLSDKIRVTVSKQISTERRLRQKTNSSTYTTEFDHVGTWGFQAEGTKNLFSNWQMVSGVDVYKDKVNSTAIDLNLNTSATTIKRGLYADRSTMSAFSVFNHHQMDAGKWTITAGARINKYGIQIPDKTFGEVKLTPAAFAWNIGAMYALHTHLKMVGQINTSYRAPNINDLSSFGKFDYGTEVPSPSLKPETGFNKEIGFRYTRPNVFFSIVGYHNNIQNLIDRTRATYQGDSLYNGDKVYVKSNVGKIVIYGIETEANVRLNNHWTILANATYTHGQNKTLNEPVRRIPPAFGRISSEYSYKKFFAALDLSGATAQNRLSSGDKSDHRINPKGTPGWGIMSVRAGYRAKNLSIHTGMENIFDQAYRIHGSGIDGYGRMVWVKTTLQF